MKSNKKVLVNNSQAIDVKYNKIRPCIKNVKCELLRTIEGESSLSHKTYVVAFEGEEVYLNSHDIIWGKKQ